MALIPASVFMGLASGVATGAALADAANKIYSFAKSRFQQRVAAKAFAEELTTRIAQTDMPDTAKVRLLNSLAANPKLLEHTLKNKNATDGSEQSFLNTFHSILERDHSQFDNADIKRIKTVYSTIIDLQGVHFDSVSALSNLAINMREDISDKLSILTTLASASGAHTEADVRTLSNTSRVATASLKQDAYVTLAGEDISLERSVTNVLEQASWTNSVLVVGEAGAGKSGVLYRLVDLAVSAGRSVVTLRADNLPFGSTEKLAEAVQAAETGSKQGLLIIDALDAARGNSAEVTRLIESIMTLAPNWNVVASVRRFDLRYNPQWQVLFKGELDEVTDSYKLEEFRGFHHILVGDLEDKDLADLASRSSLFASFLADAPPKLKRLIENLFNLSLLCNLLPITDGEVFTTQHQLLVTYWRKRVTGDGSGADEREAALRYVCQQMRSERSLTVTRTPVIQNVDSQILDDLLRENVLRELAPSGSSITRKLAFNHHRLFDFAVSQLLLGNSVEAVMTELKTGRDFDLFLRASLIMRLEALWLDDRAEFWKLTWAMLDGGVRKVTQLLPMTVVADRTENLSDLGPLIDAARDSDHSDEAGTHLGYLVAALVARSGLDKPLWYEALVAVSSRLNMSVVYPFQTLLLVLRDKLSSAEESAHTSLNVAARNLLAFIWRSGETNLMRTATTCIDIIVQTFNAAPAESEAMLRRCLEPTHFQHRAHIELSTLANNLANFYETHPAFVRDVYERALSHTEESEDITQLGSKEMRFTSTKKQDFNGDLYTLGEKFSGFLTAQPTLGMNVLIMAVNE